MPVCPRNAYVCAGNAVMFNALIDQDLMQKKSFAWIIIIIQLFARNALSKAYTDFSLASLFMLPDSTDVDLAWIKEALLERATTE